MKHSLGISNFLEEISSLSHSVVFLYFFALITEEGFLISPGYSLELCIQMGIFPFLLSFLPLFFSQLFVRPPQTTILPFCISCGWSWSLPPVQCYKPLFMVLQVLGPSDLVSSIYLLLSLYNRKGFFFFFFSSCLNGLLFKSEFGNKKFMIWAKSAPSLIFADCIELLHLQLQRI